MFEENPFKVSKPAPKEGAFMAFYVSNFCEWEDFSMYAIMDYEIPDKETSERLFSQYKKFLYYAEQHTTTNNTTPGSSVIPD